MGVQKCQLDNLNSVHDVDNTSLYTCTYRHEFNSVRFSIFILSEYHISKDSCHKKKIKIIKMEYFNAGYKNVIYERRFIIVCSNISYKPFNLNLFGQEILFLFFKKNTVGL